VAFLYQVGTDGTQCKCWELGSKAVVVGRGDIADVIVPDDSLSWSHFLIVREGEEFFLVDLNSSNGTWVNEARVTAHRLAPGERLRAGESFFYFSRTPVPNSAMAALLSLTQCPGVAGAEAGRT
jgi:pSer/pThr/pTyr-binding forkhead associated (FHA) protein